MWAEGHFHIRARCVNFPWITQGITSHAGEGKPPSRETSQLFHFATRSFFPCLYCLLFSLHFHQPGVTWKAAVRNRREAAEAGLPSEDALHECDWVQELTKCIGQVHSAHCYRLLMQPPETRQCGAPLNPITHSSRKCTQSRHGLPSIVYSPFMFLSACGRLTAGLAVTVHGAGKCDRGGCVKFLSRGTRLHISPSFSGRRG